MDAPAAKVGKGIQTPDKMLRRAKIPIQKTENIIDISSEEGNKGEKMRMISEKGSEQHRHKTVRDDDDRKGATHGDALNLTEDDVTEEETHESRRT